MVVIPDRRGTSLMIAVLLPYVTLVRLAKERKKIELELSRVKLAKDRIWIVGLGVFLLIHYHTIEKLHVCAPSGNGFQSLLRIADFSEKSESLVPFGLGFLRNE